MSWSSLGLWFLAFASLGVSSAGETHSDVKITEIQMNQEYLIAFENKATAVLAEEGITLRWGKDFNAFQLLLAQQPERHDIAPGFNPAHHRGAGLDGIWLAAYDENGVLIHTQAARHMTIEADFQDHMTNAGECYEPSYWKFDSKRSRVSLSPPAAAIKGSAAYHGENWMLGGPNGYRGGHYIYLFCRLMFSRILQEWNVDTIYGFVTPQTGPRGLSQRVGYLRCELSTVVFEQNDSDPVELWLVWMTREEAQFVMNLPPEYYVRHFSCVKNTKMEEIEPKTNEQT